VRILKKDRAVVASKLINVPASRILDVYRDKLQWNKEINRVDLITRKDIKTLTVHECVQTCFAGALFYIDFD
jgi:hypothetical protein